MRELSPAECRVLERAAGPDRPTLVRIGADLHMSPRGTVNTLLTRAYRKLGAHNRWEAIYKHQHLRGHVCQHLRLAKEHEAAI